MATPEPTREHHLPLREALLVELDKTASPRVAADRVVAKYGEKVVKEMMWGEVERLLTEYARDLISNQRHTIAPIQEGESPSSTGPRLVTAGHDVWRQRFPAPSHPDKWAFLEDMTVEDVRHNIRQYQLRAASNAAMAEWLEEIETLVVEHGVQRVGQLRDLGLSVPAMP